MVEPFPAIEQRRERRTDEDGNPGIQLLGRRFFGDQSIPEFLVELLLVASSMKRIGESGPHGKATFPSIEALRGWPAGAHLEYAAKARLNLKLFAFLGASKLETRHEAHRQHYHDLLARFQAPDRLVVAGTTDRMDVLRTLENLFLGFQGVGGQRTWCAQAFLPVCEEVLAAETIWNETQARRDGVTNWDAILERFARLFSLGRHRFLARGGELLFLQLCNALRQDENLLVAWCRQAGLSLSDRERAPGSLHESLGDGLSGALRACPETVGKLAAFIDTAVDQETAKQTDLEQDGQSLRFTKCGWCPAEGWPEGYLFAVELLRLCDAELDPVDRLELMSIGCAMQVLRSLCAQSARYAPQPEEWSRSAGPLGFVWAISDPEGQSPVVKEISRRCVKTIQRMIHDAVRHPDILAVVAQQRQRDEAAGRPWKDPLMPYHGANGADSRYGHKLFLSVAKRIGLIVPKRGPGARFVMNDKLLRYLVMTTVRPGERVTYTTFKALAFAHYGLALDDERLGDACVWCGTSRLSTLGGNADAWVVRMLDAAGMLIRLSDSCSLVVNPFDRGS